MQSSYDAPVSCSGQLRKRRASLILIPWRARAPGRRIQTPSVAWSRSARTWGRRSSSELLPQPACIGCEIGNLLVEISDPQIPEGAGFAGPPLGTNSGRIQQRPTSNPPAADSAIRNITRRGRPCRPATWDEFTENRISQQRFPIRNIPEGAGLAGPPLGTNSPRTESPSRDSQSATSPKGPALPARHLGRIHRGPNLPPRFSNPLIPKG